MKTIKLTETKLRNIISESVKKVLNEAIEIANNVPEKFRKQYLAKMISEHPDLDPDGFFWIGGNLKHSGKKKVKRSVEKIGKPEGMSEKEYEEKIVIPNNKEFAEKINRYPDEEFRPVVNGGRYFGGDADYGNFYEVSNYGRLKVLNHGNCLKSNIYDGYPAPTRNAMQFHLNFSGEGEDNMKTCPAVHYMVANAFLGEHNPKEWKVIHIDGDWRNNMVDNLKWVKKNKMVR